jgi:uncharacterized integral membrane protein (TIGR00697 family)
MSKAVTSFKGNRLFLILGGFFIANALIAEFIGVKIFSFEQSMGFDPVNWDIFGYELSFQLTAGVLLWPVVFIMTDLINEYFGPKGVRFLSNGAVILIAYAFLMVYLAIWLTPAEWWTTSKAEAGVDNLQTAYRAVFGQGLWIIIGSLVAFLVGQIIDVLVFKYIKLATGEKHIWLRATGSTLVSQLIDSFVVLFIAFYIGANWPLSQVLAIGLMNYIYKFTVAVLLTPVLYWAHALIDNYLGEETAKELKEIAMRTGV